MDNFEDLTAHFTNSFTHENEILLDDGKVNTVLSLYDDGYKAIADRTSLYDDVGMDFNKLLTETDYTLEVYVDFYPNGDVKATMVAASDEQGYRDYEIPLSPDEKEFLKKELNDELALNNESLDSLFTELFTNADISEQLKNSFDDFDYLETNNGIVNAILRLDDDTMNTIALRTSLLTDLNTSYNLLMAEENTSLSVYADFYPNGVTSATLVLESPKYGGADFDIPLECNERMALVEGLSNHLAKEGKTLNEMFIEADDNSKSSKKESVSR